MYIACKYSCLLHLASTDLFMNSIKQLHGILQLTVYSTISRARNNVGLGGLYLQCQMPLIASIDQVRHGLKDRQLVSQ